MTATILFPLYACVVCKRRNGEMESEMTMMRRDAAAVSFLPVCILCAMLLLPDDGKSNYWLGFHYPCCTLNSNSYF